MKLLKFTDEKIKYFVNKDAGIVTAVVTIWMDGTIPAGDQVKPIAAGNLHNLHYGFIKCTGFAYCSPNDTFNEKTGKAIAKARAEKTIYEMARTNMIKLSESLNDTIDSLDNMITSQRDYIRKLSK